MGSLWMVVMLTAVVLAVMIGIPIVIAGIRVASRRSVERAYPRLQAEARVVDKRTRIEGGSRVPTDQRYFVTFEFPDGSRLELDVPGPESGLLVVGDHGSLEWQGHRYLGFTREIMR